MPKNKDPYAGADAALDEAQRTLDEVHGFRVRTRWGTRRPGSTHRNRDIGRKLVKIDVAMRPIRSYIGKVCWHASPNGLEDRLRAMSKLLQHERKQLKKMSR